MGRSKEELIRTANEEILVKGNLETIEVFFAPDYVVHAGGKDHNGHSFVKRFARQIRSSLPDVQVVAVEILVQKQDVVAWQRTLQATHKSELRGIPPSGRKVVWRDMMVSRFSENKIVEEWAVSDLAAELMLKIRPGQSSNSD